jgi:hypothetical protein
VTLQLAANRLYVIAERNRGRDEYAPTEPVPSGRAFLAAALTNGPSATYKPTMRRQR